MEHWSLITLWENMMEIGAKIVTQALYVNFQTAEFAVPREMFHGNLRPIAQFRVPPAPA